ncbi:MAG TPA: hypothetical protein VJQ59_02080 [Candidatus Sulfotelmatobacter sp.]|nr:hypothetical protein [Candidatus Sulfotelmatobacter sp.]
MKIYLVSIGKYEERDIVKAFTTKEAAQKYVDERNGADKAAHAAAGHPWKWIPDYRIAEEVELEKSEEL